VILSFCCERSQISAAPSPVIPDHDARHPRGGSAPARGLSRYSAEPKLDGQRALLHLREHRTVHAFSRRGQELIRLPGLAWLREIGWPVARAVLDGEAVAGDGSEDIQAVFEARTRPGNPMAFAAFDLLALDGQSVMAEPWDGPANI
jgi:ATP-dependent DNA ligase